MTPPRALLAAALLGLPLAAAARPARIADDYAAALAAARARDVPLFVDAWAPW